MRSSSIEEAKVKWEKSNLPNDLTGKTFLDIGCWGGAMCCRALELGASRSIGIDMVKSNYIDSFRQKYSNFEFLQLDVFSQHFLSLPRFDIVYCARVLYHVP